MDVVLRYRGREVTSAEVQSIRRLIAANPGASRRALSSKLCEEWNWVQPNGTPRDMQCRSMMLQLHREGHIELPPPKKRPPNPLAKRRRPAAVGVDDTPIESTLRELGPLTIRQVRRTPDEAVVNGLIETYHYLGYTQPVGEQLKHLVLVGDRPIACFTWSSAPRHLGPRDRFIGWSAEARRQNIRFVAYNSRFLILPWVRVPHLASHLLGRMTRTLAAGLAEGLRPPGLARRDLRPPRAIPRNLLSGRELGLAREDHGARQGLDVKASQPAAQGRLRLSVGQALPPTARRATVTVAGRRRPGGSRPALKALVMSELEDAVERAAQVVPEEDAENLRLSVETLAYLQQELGKKNASMLGSGTCSA